MASIKIGKKVLENITDVKIFDLSTDGNYFVISVLTAEGKELKSSFLKKGRFRLELKGNLLSGKFANCATVFGDIQSANVGNSARVDGFVVDYSCPRGSISVDTSIEINYGNAARARKTYTRATIVHIDGDIRSIECNVSNVEFEYVVFGNCKEISVSNCLSCKGKVANLVAGNIIYCNCGVHNKSKVNINKQSTD